MIVVHPENCTGCMLVCSYTYTKKFSFSASRIKIREYMASSLKIVMNVGSVLSSAFMGHWRW